MEEIFKFWIKDKNDYKRIELKEANSLIRNNMTNSLKDLFHDKNEIEVLKGDTVTIYNNNINLNNDTNNNNLNNISDDFYKNIYKQIKNMKFNSNIEQ